MCLNTPTQSYSSNINNSPPSAPRRKARVALETTTLVLDNLKNLSAPPLDPVLPVINYNFSSFYNPQNPLFNKSLLQMRQGGALQKLRNQRDAALAKEREQEEVQEKATSRLIALSMQDSKSGKDAPSNSKVKLVGRNTPKRANSSTALSA